MAGISIGLDEKLKKISLSELSYNQKQKLLVKLVGEFKKGNAIFLPKIFEVIDSLPIQHYKIGLVNNIGFNLKGDIKKAFEKEALLRYKNRDDLINILVSNNISYNEYKLDIIKKVLPLSNSLEINGILKSLGFFGNDKLVVDYIFDNYKGTIDKDVFMKFFNGKVESKSLKIFNMLSYEDKIKIVKNMPASEGEKWIENISDLKDEDALYLKKNTGKKNVSISKEGFIRYLEKYGDIDYWNEGEMDHFTEQELKEILENVNKESPLYFQIQTQIMDIRYSKLNEKEKIDYLSKVDFKLLEMNFYRLKKVIMRLDDNFLLKKINGNKLTNIYFAQYILNKFDIDELKKNRVKLSGYIVRDLGLDYSTLIDVNEVEEKNILAQSLVPLSKNNEKSKALLKSLLISGADIKSWRLDDIFSFEEVVEILKSNKNISDSLDYSKYNEEELLKLKNYVFNNKDYLKRVLSLKDYDGDINNDFNRLQLEMLSIYNEKDNSLNSLSIFNNVDIIRDLIKTKNKQGLLNVLAHFGEHSNLFERIRENNLDKQALLTIDSSGKLLELYESISEENKSKLGQDDYSFLSMKQHFFIDLLNINKNKDELIRLKEENPFIMLTMNYKLLDFLQGKSLEYFSRYEDFKQLYSFPDGSKEMASKLINRILETRKYPDELIARCLFSLSKLRADKIDDLLNDDIDKIIYLMNKDSVAFASNIKDFEIKEKEYCDYIMKTSEDINECLDAYFRDKCKMDLESAKRMVRVYGNNLERLKELYSKDAKMIKSFNMLENIKHILEINDKEKIVKLYKVNRATNNFCFQMSLEENLQTAYNKEIISNLYIPRNEDKKHPNIYEVSGEFNMLVSVIGAYVKNPDSTDNPSENWNDKEKAVNHGICSSLIANNNLSFAYDKDKLIYGFNSLDDTSLLKVASYDLYSDSNSIEVNSLKEEQYRTARDIINNVREGHSELIIERRKSQNNQKRQPDYIVAIDTIREMDIKAAKEFNIPIVLIKSEKIALQQSKKISNLYKEALSDPTPDKIEKMITEYHNNYAGLLQVNPKLNTQYFNPKKFEKMLGELVDSIYSAQDNIKKEELLQSFMTSLNNEEKKRILVREKSIPFKFDKLKRRITQNAKDTKRVDNIIENIKAFFKR